MYDLVTKKDLQEAIQASEKRLGDKLDTVMKKLNDMSDEYTLQIGKISQINDLEDDLESLEKRVQKLEHPTL